MECCNIGDTSKKNDLNCPKCNNNGTKVKTITLHSLVKNLIKKNVRSDMSYKFCNNNDCEIVYFSEDKNHFFTKSELKVKATLKDKGLDVNTCYCFDLTRQNILDEINETGNSTVVETIKAKMKNPGCFCEISNPQGVCCLANNIAWVKEAKKMVSK